MIWVDAKDTTDDYRSIDVRRWNREGLLTPHRSFVRQWSRRGEVVASIGVRTKPDRVILTYCQRNGHKDWSNSYTVDLDWTDCNFGGKRPWFLCPGNGSEPGSYCVGWEPGCLNGHGEKPKGMRWDTFERLAAQHDACVDFVEASFVKPKGMHWTTFERLVAQRGAPVGEPLAGIIERHCRRPPGS